MHTRNRDVDFPFRQDSDFYYLTGFNEPDALAVFIPDVNRESTFYFAANSMKKKPCGKARIQDWKALQRITKRMILSRLMIWMTFCLDYWKTKTKVFYPMGRDSELDHSLLEWINHIRSQSRTGVIAPGELASLELILHEMRLFKSAANLN